ncbi:hypothetical protein F4861DRAFT_513030 [Xylaria intraflava]|nr:hypothetical protein F4861DRAFT_513030 [Xylaria intraflava]
MPGASPPRSGRPLTTSYADLMKPDEDWRNLPNAAERRKIQNRLAQRAYRRNMRDRSKEVERLKKQVQELQGFFGSNSSILSPIERAFMSGSRSPSSSENTPILHQAEPVFVRDGSPHVNNYMQRWSHLHGPQQMNNLNLIPNENIPTSAAFDPASPYFSRLPTSNDVAPDLPTAPNLDSRPRDVITSIGPCSSPHQSSPRSHSMPATFSTNHSNPLPWYSHAAERQGTQPTSACGFSMYGSPSELSPYHPESVYSLGDSLAASTAHSRSPDSELNSVASLPSADVKTQPIARPGTSSMTTPFMANADGGDSSDPSKPLPETTAPLLHFAVAGGNVETLRLLLQQSDVNLNGKDSCGYTALQRAVMCGRTDMAAMLLERGASQEGGVL